MLYFSVVEVALATENSSNLVMWMETRGDSGAPWLTGLRFAVTNRPRITLITGAPKGGDSEHLAGGPRAPRPVAGRVLGEGFAKIERLGEVG